MTIGFILMRRSRYRGGGAMGNALQEMHATKDPGMKHSVIEQRREHTRKDELGEPPL
jgi:hypothetical protein